MKKRIRIILIQVITIGMVCLLILCYGLQMRMVHSEMDESSKLLFEQLNRLLYEGTLETDAAESEYSKQCLMKAQSAAFMVQNMKKSELTEEKMDKIAGLLDIDEIHLFDTAGKIYMGSEPKYWGYTFNSGKQMRFFAPMLEDKNLELCQSITPNTAEGKLMQYAAVWREDGKGIVQIGMEPIGMIRLMEKNELSHIFSMLTKNTNADLYAADSKTLKILSATDKSLIGKSLKDIGLTENMLSSDKGFHATLNGKNYYCVFTDINGVLMGRAFDRAVIYSRISGNLALLVICLLLICVVMILTITWYLDKYIIRGGIQNINRGLQKISAGKLDRMINVHTTPEFTELSEHINHMVKSILEYKSKLSSVLNMVSVTIGVYEYSHGASKVQIAGKVPELLALSKEQEKALIADADLFEKRLEELKKDPVEGEENIFHMPGNPERLIQMETYIKDDGFFGILIDVTKEITVKQLITQERDEDQLTGLYNRRAFTDQVLSLFESPNQMHHAALIMIDTDELKKINDNYGHPAGDRYLRGMAEVLSLCTAPKQITGRLSGDEFAVLIYGCKNMDELQRYIGEIEQYQNGFDIKYEKNIELSVHYSIGVAYYPEEGSDYHELLDLADNRMYNNKHRKKYGTGSRRENCENKDGHTDRPQ